MRILGEMDQHGGAECDAAAEHPPPANRSRGQIESVSIHGSSLSNGGETAAHRNSKNTGSSPYETFETALAGPVMACAKAACTESTQAR